MTSAHRKGVALFLLLTFGLAWLTWIGLRAAGVPFLIRTALGMYAPAVAAALVRGPLRHEGFMDAGLRPGTRGWPYLAAYLIVPGLLLAGLGLALLGGVQHWTLPDNLHRLAVQLGAATRGRALPPGMDLDQLARLSALVSLVAALTFAIPINMAFTFGEEFGWRGYLLPRLAPLGELPAALLTGVAWGVWHAPVITLDGYNFPGHPIAGVVAMVLFTTPFGVVLAWLRFRSGSIWPAVLGHAALNAQAGIVGLALSSADSLLRAPLGIVGILPSAAFAGWLVFSGQVGTGRVSPDYAAGP